eukprot:gene13789-19698_t
MTGENWDKVMLETMTQVNCMLVTQSSEVVVNGSSYPVYGGSFLDPDSDADLIAAIPSQDLDNHYMLSVSFMLLQLVIGIILDEVQATCYLESLRVKQDHVRSYTDAWRMLDPKATGFIPISTLTSLLASIPHPLGVRGRDKLAERTRTIIMTTDIPNRTNKVHFFEVLYALAGRVAGSDLPMDVAVKMDDKMIHRLPNDLPKYTAADYYAAMQVACTVKGFLQRLKLQQAAAERSIRKQHKRHNRCNPSTEVPAQPPAGSSSRKQQDRRDGCNPITEVEDELDWSQEPFIQTSRTTRSTRNTGGSMGLDVREGMGIYIGTVLPTSPLELV